MNEATLSVWDEILLLEWSRRQLDVSRSMRVDLPRSRATAEVAVRLRQPSGHAESELRQASIVRRRFRAG